MHGGGEVFHVHHVHGGSVRWRRQPGTGSAGQISGVDKTPPLLPGTSERTDSQTLGPSETFDVEHECSAGRLPAVRRRLPRPLPHRPPLLRRHVGALAGVQHASGRHGVDGHAAAAAGAAAIVGRDRRPAVTSDELGARSS